jgi:hypothetical protein
VAAFSTLFRMATAKQIFDQLAVFRFPLNDEKQLQQDIHSALSLYVPYREYRLDDKSIIDFIVGDIGIEVKLSGSRRQIYQQCKRYCEFEQISSLILITNRSMGLPQLINGKKSYILNLGIAWL